MINLIGIAVSGLMLSILLRNYNKVVSVIISIASSMLIFIQVIGGTAQIFNLLNQISADVRPVEEYVKLMIKVLGITLASQFVADMCRDCGENALAGTTETATKVIVISMILPLFETVIKIVTGLIE